MVSAEPYVIDASATVEYLLETDVGLQVAALIAGALMLARFRKSSESGFTGFEDLRD